jgi:hypothetical protein
MGTSRRYAGSLGPQDLRAACSAFDAALKRLDQSLAENTSTREAVATFIMQQTLNGEHDPARLSDAVVAHFRLSPLDQTGDSRPA